MPRPCISLAGKYDIPRGLWTSWALNPCQSLPALVRTTVGAVGGVPAAVLGPQAEPDITGILAAYSPEPTGGVPAGRRHRFQVINVMRHSDKPISAAARRRRTAPHAEHHTPSGCAREPSAGRTHIREWPSTPVSALALLPSASVKPPTMSVRHNCIAARSQRFIFGSADLRCRSIICAHTNARYAADSDGTRLTPHLPSSNTNRRGPRYGRVQTNSTTPLPPRLTFDADTTPADATGSINPSRPSVS